MSYEKRLWAEWKQDFNFDVWQCIMFITNTFGRKQKIEQIIFEKLKALNKSFHRSLFSSIKIYLIWISMIFHKIRDKIMIIVQYVCLNSCMENTFTRWMNFHGYESCSRSELKSIASFIKPYKEIICIVSWGTTPRLFIYVYLLSDVIRRSYFDARPVKCDTGRWCSV